MATLTKHQTSVVKDVIKKLRRNPNEQCFGYTTLKVYPLDDNGDPDFDCYDEYHCAMHYVLESVEENHENSLTYLPLNCIEGEEDFVSNDPNDIIYEPIFKIRHDETGEVFNASGQVYYESATQYIECECGDDNCEIRENNDSAYWWKYLMTIDIEHLPKRLRQRVFNDISQADILNAEQYDNVKNQIKRFGFAGLSNLNDWGVGLDTIADIFQHMLALSERDKLPITGE